MQLSFPTIMKGTEHLHLELSLRMEYNNLSEKNQLADKDV